MAQEINEYNQVCMIRVDLNTVNLRSSYFVKVDRYNPKTGRASGGYKSVPHEWATRFRFQADAVRYAERMYVGGKETITIVNL